MIRLKANKKAKMIDKEILQRYLTGNGSLQDRETVASWFADAGEERQLRECSFSHWENPNQPTGREDKKANQLLDKIHHTIRLQEKSPVRYQKSGIERTIGILSRIAAVLFIPLAVYLWTLRDHILPAHQQIVQSEIVCPPGTRTRFHLPDGTRGWLNGGSSLKYPMAFSGHTREVQLNGEAFFEVESSPRKPFIVHGNRLQVKAYGTSFNVMDHSDDQRSEVSLLEGNVDVAFIGREKLQKLGSLHPGEVCSFNAEKSNYQITSSDIEKRVAWMEGKLIFRDESFIEVVKKCNRWYNVNIVIVDKALEDYTYVGTLQDETLEEVLRLLSLTAPVKYVDMGRTTKADGTFEKRVIELHMKD